MMDKFEERQGLLKCKSIEDVVDLIERLNGENELEEVSAVCGQWALDSIVDSGYAPKDELDLEDALENHLESLRESGAIFVIFSAVKYAIEFNEYHRIIKFNSEKPVDPMFEPCYMFFGYNPGGPVFVVSQNLDELVKIPIENGAYYFNWNILSMYRMSNPVEYYQSNRGENE